MVRENKYTVRTHIAVIDSVVRIIHEFSSDVLNIGYVEGSKKCTLTYNLELITKDEIDQQVQNFGLNERFTISRYPDENSLDYTVICIFNDTETNDTILEHINEFFVNK